MAKGSKIVPVRIPERLYEELIIAMEAANRVRREEPYCMSTYIRHCCVAKLDHLERARKKSRGRKYLDGIGTYAGKEGGGE